MRISWYVLISWANERVTVVCLFVIPAIFKRESTPRPLLDTRLKTAGMTDRNSRFIGRSRLLLAVSGRTVSEKVDRDVASVQWKLFTLVHDIDKIANYAAA